MLIYWTGWELPRGCLTHGVPSVLRTVKTLDRKLFHRSPCSFTCQVSVWAAAQWFYVELFRRVFFFFLFLFFRWKDKCLETFLVRRLSAVVKSFTPKAWTDERRRQPMELLLTRSLMLVFQVTALRCRPHEPPCISRIYTVDNHDTQKLLDLFQVCSSFSQ